LKESTIVVAGSRAEPFRPALQFSTRDSLLVVAVPLPLAVFVDELVIIDRRDGTQTGPRTVTEAKTPLS
jgi:hypothetical protein